MDHKLKKEYGKEPIFWGGSVNTQSTLATGTPQQVREEVKRNVEAFAEEGGYVSAAAHNIQSNVPIENIIALWEAFLDCRG